MTLRMVESFDGVSTFAQLVDGLYDDTAGNRSNMGKWLGNAQVDAATFTLAAGRTGNALKGGTEGSTATMFSRMINLGTEVFVGFAFNPSSALTKNGILVMHNQTPALVFQLNFNAAGTLTVSIPAGVGTTTATVPVGEWSYIEVRYKMADSGGVIELKKNGVVILRFDGDTLSVAGSTSIQRVGIQHNGTSANQNDMWDDIYICDTAGSVNNNYLGNTRIRCIRPSGNGNSSQLVGSDGNSTDNYLLVDEQSTNDADYVESTADGDKDTYAFEDVATLGNIAGVQLTARAAALNGGDPKDFNGVARLSGGTESERLIDLDTVLRQQWTIFEEKPGTGAWTDADVDGAEFGLKQVDA